ncbi:MAG: hypothetical protein JXB03_12695 [Spirochaetales bacterium]|nr:hypothetical protein [Spirochaetales bacterium]
MKKRFATFIDQSAADVPSIIVSAGAVGLQMEITPDVLKGITGAVFADLCVLS